MENAENVNHWAENPNEINRQIYLSKPPMQKSPVKFNLLSRPQTMSYYARSQSSTAFGALNRPAHSTIPRAIDSLTGQR